MKIAIINCVNSKHQTAMPAGDLYTSISFRAKKAFVEKAYDKWYIFSLKYGIISPDTIIEPYNISLALNNRNNFDCEKVDKVKLKQLCLEQLKDIEGEIHWHTPRNYYDIVSYSGYNVKQQVNQSLACEVYSNALNTFIDTNLTECLSIIQAPKPKNPEPHHNWIHLEYGEFYGRSYDLVRAFPNQGLDDADARKVGFGKNKTHKKWAIKRD